MRPPERHLLTGDALSNGFLRIYTLTATGIPLLGPIFPLATLLQPLNLDQLPWQLQPNRGFSSFASSCLAHHQPLTKLGSTIPKMDSTPCFTKSQGFKPQSPSQTEGFESHTPRPRRHGRGLRRLHLGHTLGPLGQRRPARNSSQAGAHGMLSHKKCCSGSEEEQTALTTAPRATSAELLKEPPPSERTCAGP